MYSGAFKNSFDMQGYGPKCGQVLGSGITRQDKEEILRVHNELRAKVAQGKENRGKPGPQPPAADMEQMVESPFLYLFGRFQAFSTFVLYHIFYGLHSWQSKLHCVYQGCNDPWLEHGLVWFEYVLTSFFISDEILRLLLCLLVTKQYFYKSLN